MPPRRASLNDLRGSTRGRITGIERFGFWLETSGVGAAGRGLDRLDAGLQQLLGEAIVVGSSLPYAYGIHFGHHRSGGLARRIGGTYSLQAAIGAVYPRMTKPIMSALPEGAGAVWLALRRLQREIAEETYAREAVRSGRLRESYLSSLDDETDAVPPAELFEGSGW